MKIGECKSLIIIKTEQENFLMVLKYFLPFFYIFEYDFSLHLLVVKHKYHKDYKTNKMKITKQEI